MGVMRDKGWRRMAARGVLSVLLLPVAGLLIASAWVSTRPVPAAGSLGWGVTFSQKASAELGLDWRANYLAVVRELRPTGVRLVAYWDLVEPEPGRYDFRDLDWQMAEAERAGIPVILAVGRKVPRWPEYHFPRWVDHSDAEASAGSLRSYLRTVVERYRGSRALLYWQVENEPFVRFGIGPPPDADLLASEVSLVRRLDPRHPVVVTDSGEFGRWEVSAAQGDVFGTTLYRTVEDGRLGQVTYPFSPEDYLLKDRLTKLLIGRPRQPSLCIELQAEPWAREPLGRMSVRRQAASFTPRMFRDTVAFARRTGFSTFYLWGAEWWYAMRTRGDARYWEYARGLMRAGAQPELPGER